MTEASARTELNRAEGESAPEQLPRRFGKYTLIRRLAAGGMAVLYLAIHRSIAGIERLLVIKRILPEYGRDKGYIEMLLKEARIAMTFAHANIVTVFDVGQVGGEYFIAMEHIHGEDLRAVVRAMKPKGVMEFPLPHALAIGIGVAAGLAYAHEKKDLQGNPLRVVHRDISPQNIVVTFTGDVKVVDFGIAKATHEHAPAERDAGAPAVRTARLDDHTGSGQVRRGERDTGVSLNSADGTGAGKVKGKIPYMSPEQARGDDLDHRSDIFSLGIMLFELCTGRRLFRGGSDVETLTLITDGNYPRAADVNPRIGPELEAVLMKALAPDRDERYQSARELQSDLEAVARNERIPVSSVALGEWMKMLFAERLAEQDAALAVGKLAADEMGAADDAEAEREAVRAAAVSAMPPPAPSRRPVIILSGVLAAVLASGAYLYVSNARQAAVGAEGRSGSLAVRSTPDGAHIWLNDAPTSFRTPHDFTGLATGSAGTYHVRVTAEGYEPFTADVQLEAPRARRDVVATLARLRAASFTVLEVSTTPPGARVLVDGREAQGATPLTVPELAPGVEHTVVVREPDHVDETFTFVGAAGRVEARALTLRERPLGPAESWLEVTTEPPAARLRINDREYAGGSPYRIRLAAQARPVPVTVFAPGYEGETRAAHLVGGQTVNLRTVRLAASGHGESGRSPHAPPVDATPGHLRVGANPWCNVSVDGRAYGQTPLVNITLPPGSHRVTCTSPEAPTRTRSVTLAPGQNLPVVFGAQ